ncbi:MAG: hypothetical protein H5T69_09330, partial [Chloroflexi bacterium]|nr:hypothetical protein [Chloroflexota bacterium]
MHWQFHQVMLPLVASGLVALSMAIVGLRRRHIVGAWFFVGITLLLAAWCLGYILEIGSLSLADKMIWISAQYTVIAFIPVFWFVFAVRYISWGERPEPHLILLLSCLPLITVIIVWTNPYHELMYRHLALDVGPLLTMVRMEYGPWFWVHTIYCYLLLAAGMFFVGWRMVRGPNVFRGQATSLFVAALIPWLGNAVYILSGRAPLR